MDKKSLKIESLEIKKTKLIMLLMIIIYPILMILM